jgi:hypothetical protein
MDQRNQETVQQLMLASDGSTGVCRLITSEYPSVGLDRWAGGLAAKRGRGHLDLRVVADRLDLPDRISSADESAVAVDGHVLPGYRPEYRLGGRR